MLWEDAITTVLRQSDQPRHYAEIAEEIAEKGYREPSELGATPANTVATVIGNSLRDKGDDSPFVRVARGYYALRAKPTAPVTPPVEETSDDATSPASGIINALGMFWERSKVLWKTEPQLLGRQQQDSKPVDFGMQIGVYLLRDAQGVVYVGRAIEQPLGRRLQQHTVDRLAGRWNRFSWFGIYPVESEGSLKTNVDLSKIEVDVVVSTLEAVLIEGLEPRQNRRRGDDFQAVEFLQLEDPAIEKKDKQALLAELAARL
jgi:hypothetical protein